MFPFYSAYYTISPHILTGWCELLGRHPAITSFSAPLSTFLRTYPLPAPAGDNYFMPSHAALLHQPRHQAALHATSSRAKRFLPHKILSCAKPLAEYAVIDLVASFMQDCPANRCSVLSTMWWGVLFSKEVVKSDKRLHLAGVSVLANAKRCHHRQMYGLARSDGGF